MQWIGIQLVSTLGGEEKVQVAKLSYSKKRFTIEQLQEESIAHFYNVLSQEKLHYVCAGLPAYDVVFRKISLPSLQRKKVASLLPFQLEPLIAYPLEEAIISANMELQRTEKQTLCRLFFAKKEAVKTCLQQYEDKKIALDGLFCAPSALAHFVLFFFQDLSSLLAIYVEKDCIITTILEKGKIISSHTFSSYTSEKDWDRIFSILMKKEGFSLDGQVLFLGPLCPSLEKILPSLPSSLSLLHLEEYKGFSPSLLGSFAIPIGLALESSAKMSLPSFSFTTKELITPLMRNKKRKLLLSFTKKAACFSLLLLGLASLHIAHKKTRLVREFSQVFLSKEEAIHTVSELETRLLDIEIEEKKKQKSYALLPPFFSATEALSLVGSLPSSFQLQGIEMTKFYYHLDSYPRAGSPTSPYAGKVQMTFCTENEETAHRFYEKFMSNNPLITLGKEVSWDIEKPYYKLTFFLHPQTGEK